MIDSGNKNSPLSYIQLEKCNPIRFDRMLEMWSLIQQLFEVLDRLHQKGLVHGDIKPDNLGWTGAENDKKLKLFDFGISFFLEKGRKYDMIRFGTPPFRAPEITEEGEGISDHKIDVYSAGITIGILYYQSRYDWNYHFLDVEYEERIEWMEYLSGSKLLTSLMKRIIHPDQQKRPYAREVLQEFFPDSKQLLVNENKSLSSDSVVSKQNTKISMQKEGKENSVMPQAKKLIKTRETKRKPLQRLN